LHHSVPWIFIIGFDDRWPPAELGNVQILCEDFLRFLYDIELLFEIFLMMPMISSVSLGFNPATTSSNSKRSGCVARARPNSSRFRSAMVKLEASESRCLVRPINSNISNISGCKKGSPFPANPT
jgi:hypothetical protein